MIVPGNGCSADIRGSNWYGWLEDRLTALGCFDKVTLRLMPDPLVARRSIWLPFLREELHVDSQTLVVGHSSGAEAAMRLAEDTQLGGVVLVAACHTDLGCENERASGYYPPSGGPWRFERMRENAGFIVQFHSEDDPFIPVSEARHVAEQLQSEYIEFTDKSHFFEPFEEIVEVIASKMR